MRAPSTRIVGVAFHDVSAHESFVGRFGSTATRTAYYAKERERPAKLAQICEELGKLLGGRVAAHYSKHAGCSSCPCSPGFNLVFKGDTSRLPSACYDKDKYDRYAFWLDGESIKKMRVGGEAVEAIGGLR